MRSGAAGDGVRRRCRAPAGADPGRPGTARRAVPGADQGAAGRAGEMSAASRGVDDVLALDGVGDPQRDPQVGVGPDVGGDHAAGPLGGQDQVDAEGPAALGDVDQAGDEVGQLARPAWRTRR